jgi:AraC-like DNA-binding protein
MSSLPFTQPIAKNTIARVLDSIYFMESNLLEGIASTKLGEIAGMSIASYQRHFLELTHSTPKEYLRGRRLNIAADRLLNSNRSVQHIAWDIGYGNVASFIRAFKAQFKTTPLQYRLAKIDRWNWHQRKLEEGLLEHWNGGGVSKEPIQVHYAPMQLAGFGSYIDHFGEDFTALKAKFAEELWSYLPGVKTYYLAAWGCMDDLLRRKIHYFFGVEISTETDLPKNWKTKNLPQTNYHCFAHWGISPKEMEQTQNFIWENWLKSHGTQVDYSAPTLFKNAVQVLSGSKAPTEILVPAV